jgi:hypothetical protein
LAIVVNIVAADEDEFVTLGESMRPLDQWSGIEAPGLDTGKITMLHCLVSGDEYDIALNLHEPIHVAETGAIVIRIADAVLEKLAAYNEEILSQLAVELAATKDFEVESYEGFNEQLEASAQESVHALLSELAGLARLADSQGQALFVWMCAE